MRHRDLRKSTIRIAPVIALIASGILAVEGICHGASKQKSGMVDYSAPVRVRVKRPASAAQIDPQSWQVVTEETQAGAYDGKQVEAPVRREVAVPRRIWSNDDLDEMPPPAWEECNKKEPRWRHLEGPHGRLSAGVIYREFEGVEFESHPQDSGLLLGSIIEDSFYDVKFIEKDWSQALNAGGPYLSYDLLFPISENWRIGQQTSFSYTHVAASRHLSNFRAEGEFQSPDFEFTDRYYNKVYEQFDSDIYTLSLGPIAEFDLGPVFLQGGFGLAINFVQYHAEAHERLINKYEEWDALLGEAFESEDQVERWEDGNHGTRVLFGFYMQGLIGVQLSTRWSLAGFARYDWNEDLEGEVGNSFFTLGMDAFSAGGQLGFSF